jgi:hypothetical protein
MPSRDYHKHKSRHRINPNKPDHVTWPQGKPELVTPEAAATKTEKAAKATK